VVRDTFTALDCRDVARVDLRMAPDGKVYVIEINPLPGLTPEFSDLCVIAKVAGMDYRMLIGEILAGSIKRYCEARQALPKEAPAASPSGLGASVPPPTPTPAPVAVKGINGA